MAVKTKVKRKNHGLTKLIFFAILLLVAVMLVKKLQPKSEECDPVFQNKTTYAGKKDMTGIVTGTSDSEVLDALYAAADKDSRINDLIENMDDYPEELIKLLVKNPEARDFVLDYPERSNDSEAATLTRSELSAEIPHFLQWDKRWGYHHYGSCMIGVTGCGPTCLSMVIVGLTGNKDATPSSVADYSEKSGFYVDGVGTSWDLMTTGAQNYGLTSSVIPLSEASMVAELNAGHPLIVNVGPGDFTDYGHFIVITGYENGMFTINDPNSVKLSNEGWYYTTLEKQIMNIWAYSLS